MSPAQRFFWIGCALEAALCLLALGLNGLSGRALWADLHWNQTHLLAGLLATLPALALFVLTLHASHGPLGRLRSFLEGTIRPLFNQWTLWQLLLISLLAGLGEELLFRGAVQGLLVDWLGLLPGLILASLLFGACHPMTLAYLMITTLIGLYLGSLWIVTGNLLAPIVTHALYDFLALLYLLHYRQP